MRRTSAAESPRAFSKGGRARRESRAASAASSPDRAPPRQLPSTRGALAGRAISDGSAYHDGKAVAAAHGSLQYEIQPLKAKVGEPSGPWSAIELSNERIICRRNS